MPYQDRYAECLAQIPAFIRHCRQTGRRSALGYTSDLDVLIAWDMDTFNRIVDAHLAAPPSYADGESIDSEADFARIVSHFMLRGAGGEMDITSKAVCDMLEGQFAITFGLGGTCAQGSAALGAVGVPIISHISDRSAPVCRFLDAPSIETISPTGERVPMMATASGKPPVKHYILQYRKGDVLRIGGQVHVIPLSNRMILDFDTLNKSLRVDEHFLRYCEENAQSLCSYNISGFSTVTSLADLQRAVERLAAHYAAVHAANPQCVIYLEAAHYLSHEARHFTFGALAPALDVLGMNEEELADLAGRAGCAVDVADLDSILEAAACVLRLYPVPSLVVHSKDYALYYGAPLAGVDVELGLTLGNLLAGTRARTGRYGDMADCAETLALPKSAVGTAFAEQLAGRRLDDGKTACLVPACTMEHPKYTIGLGDSFVAGFQICLIR